MQRRLRSLLPIATILALCTIIALTAPGTATAADSTAPASFQPSPADTLRPLQPEDLFRYHRMGDVRFSPDGEQVAYELARPAAEGAIKRLPQLLDGRSDIWVVSGEDAEPRRLTNGAPDGTGWFHPRWSPDGERLAFLSVDGNDVQAWLWERGEEKPRRLTDRSVALTNLGPLLFRWISERTLALSVRPEGAQASGRLLAEQTRPGQAAAQAWKTSWSGQEVTANVFGGDESNRLPRAEVALFTTEGSSRTTSTGRWGMVVPSPDGQWAATLSDPPVGSGDPDQARQQKMTYAPRPGVVPLTAETDEAVAEDPNPLSALDDPRPRTLRWAPDGSAFALLTRPAGTKEKTAGVRVAMYRPSEDRLRFVGNSAMDIKGFAWTGDGTLLVRARRAAKDAETKQTHWWRPPVETDGEWKNWTAGMETVPDELVAVSGGAAGVADGALWRFVDGDRERILDPETVQLRRVMGPTPSFSLGQARPQERSSDDPIRLLSTSDDGSELWTVRADASDAQTIRRFPMPRGTRGPADVAPKGNAAAFSAANEDGTWLWRSRSQGAEALPAQDASGPAAPDSRAVLDTLVARDQWLAEIEEAEARQLTYTGPNGEELTAWILLPPGQDPEGTHPTVAWIYPGKVHGERAPRKTQLDGRTVTSGIGALQVLAARGYAVLFPSVPLGSEIDGRPNFAETILPAVDRAVEKGLTDSSRVGVMGHSYGGFGVNHLVSQTDRFETAVAAAGLTHLRSFYGTFDARKRYGHMRANPPSDFTQAYFESGQGRMGAPPALVPERYREASPLSYVDEVQVPLMMIHGDKDFVPVQQAEMFFSELLRLGKQARLVRYAGEGHMIRGRANVLDMWNRIFDWFGEHLGDSKDRPR